MKITIESEDDGSLAMDIEATVTNKKEMSALIELLQALEYKVFPWRPAPAPPQRQEVFGGITGDEIAAEVLGMGEAPPYPRPGVEEPF